MVKIHKLLVNVVNWNKPKMLLGLAKGKRPGAEALWSSAAVRSAAGG